MEDDVSIVSNFIVSFLVKNVFRLVKISFKNNLVGWNFDYVDLVFKDVNGKFFVVFFF